LEVNFGFFIQVYEKAVRTASKATHLPDLVEENESELPKVDSDQPILVISFAELLCYFSHSFEYGK
jgi:hypothetical protein